MENRPSLAIASDHAGFAYKEQLRAWLTEAGYTVRDFGAFNADSSDYPDFIRPAAEAVASGACDLGIILGGSGNGEAIVANKVPGIRCGVVWNEESAYLTKLHNNANIISLGERMMPYPTAQAAVQRWLDTAFEGGRHQRRVNKIEPGPSAS